MKQTSYLRISIMPPVFLLAAFYFFATACGGDSNSGTQVVASAQNPLNADSGDCELEFNIMSMTPTDFFKIYDSAGFGRMDFVFQNQKNGAPFIIDSYAFKNGGSLIGSHFLTSEMIPVSDSPPYVFTELGFTKSQIDAYINKLSAAGINLRTDVQKIVFIPFIDKISGIEYYNIKLTVIKITESFKDEIEKLVSDQVALTVIGARDTKLNPCPPNKPGT